MKKLYFLIGYPASGKTTLAKKLSQINDYDYVSSDDLLDDLYNQGYKYSEMKKMLPNRLITEIMNKSRHATNIVLDTYAPYRHERAIILNAMPETFVKIAVVMNTSKDECVRRFNKRGKWKKNSKPGFDQENIEMPTYLEFNDIIESDKLENYDKLFEQVQRSSKQTSKFLQRFFRQ